MISRFRVLSFSRHRVGFRKRRGRLGRREARPLEIFFIDVQGGAATLIVTPERESILIDSGWPGLERSRSQANCSCSQGPGGMRPARSPGDDPLAHGSLRRRCGARSAGADRQVLGPRACPKTRMRRGDFPDGPAADDPLGKAYRKASAGKRTSLKAGDSLPLKGIKALVLASGGEVVDRAAASRFRDGAPIDGRQPPVRSRTAGSAGRHLGQRPQPGDPVFAWASSSSSMPAT